VAVIVTPFMATALTLGMIGCAVETVPDGVIGGVELPPDPAVVLRAGMKTAEVIARLGAPERQNHVGPVTTMVYTEVSRQGRHRLKLFWTPAGPDTVTTRQLHLVFQDDALRRAWIEASEEGREPATRWLLGAPAGPSR